MLQIKDLNHLCLKYIKSKIQIPVVLCTQGVTFLTVPPASATIVIS